MERQESATWSPAQEQVALRIAAGKPIATAAAEVDVGERTTHRWLTDPNYRVYIDGIRRQLLEESMGRLIGLATRAVDTFAALLDEEITPAVRLGSARSIFDVLLRIREMTSLEARIAALEARDDEGSPEWSADEA
jgi:hypothetical protein